MIETLQKSKIMAGMRRCAPFVLLPLAMGVAQAAEQEQAFELEEIIITATRRAEGTSIMDTALSVDAISGVELESRGYTSIMDALSASPGVSVLKASNAGPSVQIRGVSAIVGASVVGYYLDDLPYTEIDGNITPDLNPYDLNRVEVLRGPQGTLFGAGSQGGVVRVITQDPVMNEFSGKVSAGYSSTKGADDSHKIQGAINIPLIDDKLAMRVVAAQVNDGGYIDLVESGEDNYNEMENTSYRVKLLWTPTDELSVVASYWSSEREGYQDWADDNYEASYSLSNMDTLFGLGTTELSQPAGKDFLVAETSNDLYGLKVEYVTDDYSFLSTTSYLEGSNWDGYVFKTPPSFSLFGDSPKLDTFAQEFKLSSNNDGPWNWTLGAVYLEMENQKRNVLVFTAENPANWPILEGFGLGLAEVTALPITTLESESWALFGESVHQLNDQWELTLGARYFEDDIKQSDGAKGNFDKWTGRVNLAWTPTEDSLYYANVATGFRSGRLTAKHIVDAGIADGVNIPEAVEPDEVLSYEIGAKWTLLDGNLQLETAAYYLEWDDIITLVSGFVGGSIEGWGVNANSAKGAGFEFGATYQHDGLTLSASGNWNDIEYDGDVVDAGISDGASMMGAPELTWNASATYVWPVGELSGFAYIGATFTDERTDYAPGLSYTSDDFTVVNARIGVEGVNWSVFLTGANITDTNPEISQLAVFDANGFDAVRMRPATYGVELNYNF
ncbi:TonB-dependent receptor [Pseudomaricurvus alkylphenolicus]|uniref:TonB-dependent receptor n=1 Tax=Pseudomaricurvus alkylphenolicus TaxID=1306991 RepID=UPI0014247F64|nr:TonB-dependent receptor [Pseudomaricurvus alkylphenolicus]NIB44649.1 TonB-dependent receptor [Pseudomaricurvus alkylphenolicus]